MNLLDELESAQRGKTYAEQSGRDDLPASAIE